MFDPMRRRLINRRRQGDLGEISAIEWFARLGADVFTPIGHSPDVDLVVAIESRLFRVQVKTSTQRGVTSGGEPRYPVALSTSGGNQSWNRKIKRIDPDLVDYLFVLTGCGRRWCIPIAALEAGGCVALGGGKYSEFEIDAAAPIDSLVYDDSALDSSVPAGEYPSGQRTAPVKRLAYAFRGSNPLSPIEFQETKFERKLGKSGRAVINQKRRVTIPSRAAADAGLKDGDHVSVRAAGFGKLLLERVELPPGAQPGLTTPAEPASGEAA